MITTKLTIGVMYYSLFQKELVDTKKEIINYFPQNVFGIFTTVRRAHKLKSYPMDIHGCIGYWDTNFTNLNKQSLYNNLLRVSYDSVWKDTRNKYFTPIEKEPETMLELDFMLNPIYSINKENGMVSNLNKKFKNKYFGIIIQTKDKTQKATYLPDVFPTLSWKDMLVSIKQKATITTDDFELFAYKITQMKSTFSTILTGDLFNYSCVYNFSRLLIDNSKLNLTFPFAYSCNQNKLKWNDNDQVRNISTLAEIVKHVNVYKNIATKQEIKILNQKILTIVQNIDDYSSQAMSFLGYIYQLFDINNIYFCKKLLTDLPFAENEFEKPEIIIGLNKAGCNINEPLLTYTLNDSIFRMNWIIQAIISFNKNPTNKLILILEKKVDDILLNKKMTETNYLAVAFEALCFAYKSNAKPSILNKLFELFFELEHRKHCNNVLYSFLDKTSRVDITGHIINGLAELMH